MNDNLAAERQSLDVDIVCAGFGPAMAGFLTTLSRAIEANPSASEFCSQALPGMPLQILCYERADDLGFGVSGVVTRAKGIKTSFPDLDPSAIGLAADVKEEKVVYLLDPHGASRRPLSVRLSDSILKSLSGLLGVREQAYELPWIPSFLSKHGGLILSIGQFQQWVGSKLMGTGLVQIWPGMPVQAPLLQDGKVAGLRLVDQGVSKQGVPEGGFMPGMDIRAPLTVVGDGPVGAVGQQLNEHFGMPEGHHQRDWAVGMKMVVELPETCSWKPGTVIHTLGYPELEIFGFLYVFPNRFASMGIFVPSWFDSPVRTSYSYLQHWMTHPYLWKELKGGKLRSWGAKTLQEAGKRGEPVLVGDGFARIGEGSGTTNVLTGSGVDEAWQSGIFLAEGVIELLKAGKPFTRENLDTAYVQRRQQSELQKDLNIAEKARDGFQHSFVRGMLGMALTGLTGGKLNLSSESKRPWDRLPTVEEYYKGKIPAQEIADIQKECTSTKRAVHDALMERAGWPKIELDGQLLVSHQDALLLGGKVQAPSGFADHVAFLYPNLCQECGTKICVEVCSGQAISAPGESGIPEFDREKCVHCGACIWNCTTPRPNDSERGNIRFSAGAGGLHSAEN